MLYPDPEPDVASLLPLPHLAVVARYEEVRMGIEPGEHPGHRRPGQGLRFDLPGIRRLDVKDDVGVPLQQGLQPVGGREPARRLDAEDRRRNGRPHQQRHQQGDHPRPEPHDVILAACGENSRGVRTAHSPPAAGSPAGSGYSSSRFLPRIRFPTHAIPMDSV